MAWLTTCSQCIGPHCSLFTSVIKEHGPLRKGPGSGNHAHPRGGLIPLLEWGAQRENRMALPWLGTELSHASSLLLNWGSTQVRERDLYHYLTGLP